MQRTGPGPGFPLRANPSEFKQPSEVVPTTRSSFSPKAPAVGEASAPRSLSGHVHEAILEHKAIPKEALKSFQGAGTDLSLTLCVRFLPILASPLCSLTSHLNRHAALRDRLPM